MGGMKSLPFAHRFIHFSARAATASAASIVAVALAASLAAAPQAQANTRIKEVAAVQGVRTNSLTGYGLVVGLDGTGDQTTQMPYTTQSLQNYLQQMGITLPAGTSLSSLQLKNAAAVIVTAELPPFATPGQSIDVVVSSLGNAKSLKGGTLIVTPLRGADGEIYALAQGNVVVGGAGASQAGSKVQINHLSAGRIPLGGQVERSVPTPLNHGNTIRLGLNATDFQTATKVVQAINSRYGAGVAVALDGRTVEVNAPANPGERVAFIAGIEELPIQASKPAAKVVINARTGSIVMNQAVTLGPCAIAHGNLSVTISATPVISQPGAFSQGTTVVGEKASINVTQDEASIMNIPASPQLADVVRSLNSIGATPQDLLAILQAIKAAGALNAELEVI